MMTKQFLKGKCHQAFTNINEDGGGSGGVTSNQGSISPTFNKQLLRAQIQKRKKD